MHDRLINFVLFLLFLLLSILVNRRNFKHVSVVSDIGCDNDQAQELMGAILAHL